MSKILPVGTLAAAAIDGNYQVLLALAGSVRSLTIMNDLNAPMLISLNSGASTHYRLPAGVGITLDVAVNKVELSDNIHVKHDGAAATTGKISATAILD